MYCILCCAWKDVFLKPCRHCLLWSLIQWLIIVSYVVFVVSASSKNFTIFVQILKVFKPKQLPCDQLLVFYQFS